jgi:riboflavin synthase
MFTGIIETMGEVVALRQEGSNTHIGVRSTLSHELKADQSLSHNGVCLSVTRVQGETHWVTAIEETISRSTLGSLQRGDKLNLERSLKADGRFDGHIVQGHVDLTGRVTGVEDRNGSWIFRFEYNPAGGHMTVDKGSICVDGVSLTCFNSRDGGFAVAIIPYTYEHTTFGGLRAGDKVNLEFDIVGKYVQRLVGEREWGG